MIELLLAILIIADIAAFVLAYKHRALTKKTLKQVDNHLRHDIMALDAKVDSLIATIGGQLNDLQAAAGARDA